MKKTTRKLVVRGETLRALRELDRVQLGRVGGGGEVVAAGLESGGDGYTHSDCPAVLLVK